MAYPELDCSSWPIDSRQCAKGIGKSQSWAEVNSGLFGGEALRFHVEVTYSITVGVYLVRGTVQPYGSSVPGMNTAAVRKIGVRFFFFQSQVSEILKELFQIF